MKSCPLKESLIEKMWVGTSTHLCLSHRPGAATVVDLEQRQLGLSDKISGPESLEGNLSSKFKTAPSLKKIRYQVLKGCTLTGCL